MFMGRPNPVTPTDITLVLCLRAHSGNPWVLDRLSRLKDYYYPAPPTLVVDFGSAPAFRRRIGNICEINGFDLIHVEDYDVYSASLAHNAAHNFVATPFIFFCDIDFFMTRDAFSTLSRCVNASGDAADIIINLPAYHVSEATTEAIESLPSHQEMSNSLDRLAFDSIFEKFGEQLEFVAPYSNIYLISKDFFSLIGGYSPEFRGHGSEDFEFFLRAHNYSGYFPFPAQYTRDIYRPTGTDFHECKEFRGFRSLNQLFSVRAERFGLRAFHLWHPTSKENEWREHNDWRRERFNRVVEPYVKNKARILEIDGLERPRKALCICKDHSHWGYMAPLRLLGFETIPVFDDHQESLNRIDDLISTKQIDAFVIFNPYMKSHAGYYPLFLKARENGIEMIVIERGALPGTIYYAEDVSYVAESFTKQSLSEIVLTPEEKLCAQEYIQQLQSGSSLLENAASREVCDQKYRVLGELEKKLVFVPLQLDDDMAVTKFIRTSQPYVDFVESIKETVTKNPDIMFVVKPHPLSKHALPNYPENVIIADRSDNIHTIIDACDAVVCYNSGVGLITACHGKPLVTIGNAFYNLDGIGYWADNFSRAIDMVRAGIEGPDPDKVVDLIGKYLLHRYSFFTAEDVIKEFRHRKAHAYKDIRVNRLVYSGTAKEFCWERTIRKFSKQSYGFSQLNLQHKPGKVTKATPSLPPEKPKTPFYESLLISTFVSKRKFKKYTDNRAAFFADSKRSLVKAYKKVLL
jgi:predicted glycosyltransferase involved in capsule biosynthesis/capsule polysaccharide modification protein KpsS